MIPRRVWTFTFYYITTIHWRAPFSLCFDLRASSKISRNSMMPRFASWVSICLVIVLMIVFSHFHGHLLYMYHCVSDLEDFHWMVFSADQRFGKFLQDLSLQLPLLRARSFKFKSEDVRKDFDRFIAIFISGSRRIGSISLSPLEFLQPALSRIIRFLVLPFSHFMLLFIL